MCSSDLPVGSASLAELFSQPRSAGARLLDGGGRGEGEKDTIEA